MNILITGGAGYIGNVLTEHLLRDGHNITVYDNLIHRQGGILANCNNKKFKFIYGDVRDMIQYGKAIKNADIIINLAAYVGMPICKKFPIETQQVNQDSVEFLVTAASPDQLIIFAGTNSVYGTGNKSDGNTLYCDEESPVNPISAYAKTKHKAEEILMQNNNAIALRFATVFGTSRKMRMDLLVNDFVWRAWNDRSIVLFESHFQRNSIHICDVAKTIQFAISNSQIMKGQIYNAGNPSINISKMELCLAIKKQVPDLFIGVAELNTDPDQRNYVVSNKKIEALGWTCDYSLDMGIQELLHACPIIKNSNTLFSDI